MNQTKNAFHKQYFDNFLKNSIQLIIDSRKITKNTNQKLTFIEDMNDNNNKSLFFEDLSFDTLNSFNHSKQLKKYHTIDFYGYQNNLPKLLLERWKFSFIEENKFKSELYIKKKLLSLIRSIYLITIILPCNKIKKMNNIIIDFQSYQNFKGDNFSLEPKEFIHISNNNLNNIEITVEYLTFEQISNYFNEKVNNKKTNKKKSNRNIRYFTMFGKKQSFEVINFELEEPNLNDDYGSKRNLRKLSYDEESKNEKNEDINKNRKVLFKSYDELELIESENEFEYDNTRNENFSNYENLNSNINEENDKCFKEEQFKRMSRYKTSDTIDLQSSNSNFEQETYDNPFELYINQENKKEKCTKNNVYINVRNKFFELKEKIIISKNEGFNIQKLYCLINDIHF